MDSATDEFYHMRDQVVDKCLRNVSPLNELCEIPAQSLELPFQRTSDTYVIVWIYLKQQFATDSHAWDAAKAVITTLCGRWRIRRHIKRHEGVEVVVATLTESRRTDRKLLRVGALKSALAAIADDPQEFDQMADDQDSGLSVLWYSRR